MMQVGVALTDEVLKDMAKSCQDLEVLSIAPRRNEHMISDIGILEIAKRCLKLRDLHLGRVDISDEGLHTLGILTELRHIGKHLSLSIYIFLNPNSFTYSLYRDIQM